MPHMWLECHMMILAYLARAYLRAPRPGASRRDRAAAGRSGSPRARGKPPPDRAVENSRRSSTQATMPLTSAGTSVAAREPSGTNPKRPPCSDQADALGAHPVTVVGRRAQQVRQVVAVARVVKALLQGLDLLRGAGLGQDLADPLRQAPREPRPAPARRRGGRAAAGWRGTPARRPRARRAAPSRPCRSGR